MSTQGTGSITQYGFERQLLTAWGDWGRNDIGLWFNRVDLLSSGGMSFVFCEEDILKADSVVARLPRAHKYIIKRTYLRQKGHRIDEQRKQAAVASFAELLAGDGEGDEWQQAAD